MNWWLDEYVDVSEMLGRALGIARARTTRLTVLASLADALGLPDRRYTSDAWAVIDALVQPLARAMEEGPRLLDRRPLDIARSVANEIEAAALVPAMVELGWGSTEIRNRTTVKDLEAYLREQLSRHLGNRLDRTMRRWEQAGVYGARRAS